MLHLKCSSILEWGNAFTTMEKQRKTGIKVALGKSEFSLKNIRNIYLRYDSSMCMVIF